MIWPRLVYSIPIWLLMSALYIALIILGWVLIPLAVLCKAYKEKMTDGRLLYHFSWPFMWLWDNWEDGIASGWQYKNTGSLNKQIIYWSALRNPVNNLRITPYLSCKINAAKVRYIGAPHTHPMSFDKKPPCREWFFAWQNWYHSNLFFQFNIRKSMYRFWIGSAKIYPADVYGLEDDSYRRHGSGPVIQLKRILKYE